MTVPSVRAVRSRRVDWWDADQVGRPLTPPMAFWLRRGMLHRLPLAVARGLARRGLLAGLYIGQATTGLTARGERAREALGRVPPEYLLSCSSVDRGARTQFIASRDLEFCPACDRYLSAELIAWDLYDGAPDSSGPPCINCVMNTWPVSS